MQWRDGDTDGIAQLCPKCAALYDQAGYLSVYHLGRWIAADGTWIDKESRFRSSAGEVMPYAERVAFQLWTAQMPLATWASIADAHTAAVAKEVRGDNAEIKTFVNTTLGETWEEVFDKTDADELKSRAEPFPLRVVPMGGLQLTAGVDVQDNRFEVVVWAFGRGEEMWTVDYAVITANPADHRSWALLDDYLNTQFRHAAGTRLGISAVAVDTGGHFTQESYHFCRLRSRRNVCAIKGSSVPGQIIKAGARKVDVNFRGATVKRGLMLWTIGTDTAKDLIFGRLGVTQAGPGCIHMSNELPRTFFEQLAGEARVPERTAHGTVYRWKEIPGRRNEVLDCTVYALWCAHKLNLNLWGESTWRAIEIQVQSAQQDLFTQPDRPAEPVAVVTPKTSSPPSAHGRRGPLIR
jgi:phage terminase large subunit GpA-like protein